MRSRAVSPHYSDFASPYDRIAVQPEVNTLGAAWQRETCVNNRKLPARLLVAGLCVMFALAGCGSSAGGSSQQSGNGEGGSHSLASGWSATDLTSNLKAAERVELISCASGPFCMIWAEPYSVAFDGSEFGAAQQLGAVGTEIEEVHPVALSCTSSHFCMAIGEEYDYYIWDGSTWRVGGRIPGEAVNGGPEALSCGADGQCVAIGEDGGNGTASVLNFRGDKWTSIPMDSGGQLLTGVSCASPEFCQILGNDGYIFSFNGKSGNPPTLTTEAESQIASVSCVTGPFCIGAEHISGTVLINHGESFEQLPGIPQLLDIEPEACGSSRFCLVMPVSSWHFSRFDGRHLHHIVQPRGNPELENLSCTEEEVCMANVSETDKILIYSR